MKENNITTGKRYTAVFNKFNLDEQIEFIPVGIYSDPENGEYSIVVKNEEVTSIKNGKRNTFSINHFTPMGVLSNKDIKHLKEVV
jgi:hypothetical protein